MQERFRPSSIFVSLRLIDLSLRIFVSTPRVRCRSPGRGGIDLHASSTNDRPFSLPVAFHPVVTRSLIGSVILYEGIRVHSNSRALTVHDHEKVNEEAASLEHHFDIEARARHLSLSKFLDLLRESFGRSQRVSVRLSVCLSFSFSKVKHSFFDRYRVLYRGSIRVPPTGWKREKKPREAS